jgi:hypothetical protein
MQYQDQPANPTEYLPPRPDQGVLHEAEVRAVDIRANLHRDMYTTWATNYGMDAPPEVMVDAMVGDAMFQIEHLLVEIEALRIKDRAKSNTYEALGWPHD